METSLKWYQKKSVWTFIYLFLLLLGISYFIIGFYPAVKSLGDFFLYLIASLGGTTFYIPLKLVGITNILFSSVIYIFFVTFLIYKTYKSSLVKIIYPGTIIVLFLFSLLLNTILIGSYG